MSESPPFAPRRIEIIENPVSGSAKSHARLPVFVEHLRAGGAEVRVTRTERAGHAADLAAVAAARSPDALVVVGGDGTLNEVLNGLPPSPPPLGTFPTGTSSIFARDLAFPFEPVAAARAVLAGKRRRVDVGRANGRRFLMVVGVGWDAHVVNAVSAARTGFGGRGRYFWPIARAVLSYDFPPLRVRVDGEREARPAEIAFACNGRNYAGFFRLAPDARTDDGLLDFVLLRNGGARNYVRWTLGAATGRLPRYRDVGVIRGKRVEIESDVPVPYEVDGDPGGSTPLVVELDHESLEVIVP